MRKSVYARLMAKTSISSPEACWLFSGARISSGHGQIFKDGKIVGAHRVAWENRFGAIPDGLCVCHKCDVPNCVNPDHMFLGTRTDNNRDKENKNRHATGERHGNARLTKGMVMEIRSLKGSISQVDIAKMFGVSHSNISLIHNGKAWVHTEGEQK